ncbi:MAG: hypothetical protein HKP38_01445 [Croceitalea sp.]|nr:hypothetical protein [Croceitalea sp.]MBT8239074.1 hypothetical protein [Croceitalea sp.]NNC34139.1 hypothetical protein [Croceitalea sp.]NNL07868.1 hypothetical protein [Croceitalea sp.]NNM17556.1 hypothetical protein [Croceitalea sp.]
MSLDNETNSDFPNRGNTTTELIGLDHFKKDLERDFYSNATIRCQYVTENKLNLYIDLSCNFGLIESLFHLNNGNWGSYYTASSKESALSPFHTSLYTLAEENQKLIDIEELSLTLKDTTITIAKIFDQSIPDQLSNILSTLSSHFVHFTKGISEMPYEIFVPVFEENKHIILDAEGLNQRSKMDFFDFWGLYFESKNDPVIYDLKTKKIIEKSDFFFLNQ